MKKATTTVSVTELKTAIHEQREAWRATLSIAKPDSNKQHVDDFAALFPGTEIREAAAELDQAATRYNSIILGQYAASRKRAGELSAKFMTELFGQPCPGKVTLPSAWGGARKTLVITELTAVFDNDHTISGHVRFTNETGSYTDSTSFFVNDEGIAVFAEPSIM